MLKIVRSRTTDERKITFALPADHPAGIVSVVGNFNDWNPGAHRLVRRANGLMSTSVTLPSDYIVNFRYLGIGGVWFDEPDATFVDAGASVLWADEDAPQAAPARPRARAAKPAPSGRARPAKSAKGAKAA